MVSLGIGVRDYYVGGLSGRSLTAEPVRGSGLNEFSVIGTF